MAKRSSSPAVARRSPAWCQLGRLAAARKPGLPCSGSGHGPRAEDSAGSTGASGRLGAMKGAREPGHRQFSNACLDLQRHCWPDPCPTWRPPAKSACSGGGAAQPLPGRRDRLATAVHFASEFRIKKRWGFQCIGFDANILNFACPRLWPPSDASYDGRIGTDRIEPWVSARCREREGRGLRRSGTSFLVAEI